MEGALHSVRFNQERECFCCASETGFAVYQVSPLQCKGRHRLGLGVGEAEMLHWSQYIALVVIWDDAKGHAAVELGFNNEVKAVRLAKSVIAVALETRVSLFTLTAAPQQVPGRVYITGPNPHGLCEMAGTGEPGAEDEPGRGGVLAIPGRAPGQLQLIELGRSRKAPAVITAHENPLRCIALNGDGSRVATASDRGTCIRVFDAAGGRLVWEGRRGKTAATIVSLGFDRTSSMLCAASDHGTVHIFKLLEGAVGASRFLPSALTALPRSFAQFDVGCSSCACTFTPEVSAVVAVTADGRVVRCAFDAHGSTEISTVRLDQL